MNEAIHPVLWNEKPLTGEWTITLKVDGIRAFINEDGAVSKRGKPLLHLENAPHGDYEVFFGTWNETSSKLRTHDANPIPLEALYQLDPVDPRLYAGATTDPSVETIQELLAKVRELGYEGLVLRQGDKWIKVKSKETHDVPVIGILLSESATYAGQVRCFETPMGNVSGMTAAERKELMTLPLGTIIEVECMELTINGKFRHPRLMRVRWDKTPEVSTNVDDLFNADTDEIGVDSWTD